MVNTKMVGVFSLFMMCVTVAMVSSQSCHKNSIINGCTTPKNFKWYKTRFRKACDKHDICYKCAFTLRISRKACDDAFRRDMERTCPSKKKGPWITKVFTKRTECLTAAYTYYISVRAGGVLPMYFDYRSFNMCKEAWVRTCMP